jgi:hypothetical protein
VYAFRVASRPVRSFATLCAIGLFGLFGAVAARGIGTGSGTACLIRCDSGATIVLPGSHEPLPTPCVHDVGCGGGSALASSITPVVAVFGAVGLALAAVAMWRRRSSASPQPVGVLLASALFRPPRPAFDI